MIPINEIRAWYKVVSWISDEQVEQDLLICRALIEIYSDELLAEKLVFRGGTAIHKLFLNPPSRYSEDIDLVQKRSGPISEIINRLRNALSFISKPIIKQKANNNTLLFRFNSENIVPVPLRLKVEINCREHFAVNGYKNLSFGINTKWYNGQTTIHTYELEELLGTKLRALYQRKKGRDLYDLYKAFITVKPDPDKIIFCFKRYIEFVTGRIPTKKQFLLNMNEKMSSEGFIKDTDFILKPSENYNPLLAYELIRKELLERL